MPWLARDRDTNGLSGDYVFSFGELAEFQKGDWRSDEPWNNLSPEDWQGPCLEPGEGPIEIELKVKLGRGHDVSDLYEDEPDGE